MTIDVLPQTIDHDRLFKELLTTFFFEFLELFFPKVAVYVDPAVLEFLDKELFTDATLGERFEADLVIKTRFRNQGAFFLIHNENQAQPVKNFEQRMFWYFSFLHTRHHLPVYPIAVLSFERPRGPAKCL